MHQHPRRSPVPSLYARSPTINQMRTNNPREEDVEVLDDSTQEGHRADQSEGVTALLRIQESSVQGKETIAKLSQIVQVGFEGFIF